MGQWYGVARVEGTSISHGPSSKSSKSPKGGNGEDCQREVGLREVLKLPPAHAKRTTQIAANAKTGHTERVNPRVRRMPSL